MRSSRRGFGQRFAWIINATKVPYRARAWPSNGSCSNSTIAAPKFSMRAAGLAASVAIATRMEVIELWPFSQGEIAGAHDLSSTPRSATARRSTTPPPFGGATMWHLAP